jgi:hypothetical protein
VQGLQGVAGPTAVSTQAGNIAVLGNDGLIYVPDTVVDGTNEVAIQNSLPSEPTLELWVDPDATAGSITLSHSSLLDLAADDHPQYLTQTRGDARYLQLAGGTLTGNVTLSANPTNVNHLARKGDVDAVAARQVIAGNGLTGGGALTADRTINVGAGTGITVAADLTRDAGTGNSESVISSTAAASGTPSQGVGTVWVQY